MKLKIKPYAFTIGPKVTVVLPTGSQLLSLTGKGKVVTLWALVDEHNTMQAPRYFVCYDLTEEVNPALRLKYFATIQRFDPDYSTEAAVHMAHVFEVLLGDGPVRCKDCAHCGLVEIPTAYCPIVPRGKPAYIDHEHEYFRAPYCTKVCAIMDLAALRQCGCFTPAPKEPNGK